MEFRTDVFDADSIGVLIERLERVLVALSADPGRRLSSVDLLDAAEHARLEEVGNRAVLSQPAAMSVSIPALFDAQVVRAPEAVAMSCGDRSMTYREVDEASIGWRTCWPARGWVRVSGWRCCFLVRLRRSWRSWRC